MDGGGLTPAVVVVVPHMPRVAGVGADVRLAGLLAALLLLGVRPPKPNVEPRLL